MFSVPGIEKQIVIHLYSFQKVITEIKVTKYKKCFAKKRSIFSKIAIEEKLLLKFKNLTPKKSSIFNRVQVPDGVQKQFLLKKTKTQAQKTGETLLKSDYHV